MQPRSVGVPCVDPQAGAYTLLNASVGYTLLAGAALHSITLRADNLLDEPYYDAASRMGSLAPSRRRSLALDYRMQF